MAAHHPTAPARTTRPAPGSAERGFSLIEMLIAMAIAAILLSIIASQFLGAKKATYSSEAKTAGSAYAQAISQFHADNANRNPTAAQMPGNRGPTDLLGKPYIRSLPDGVAAGRVGFNAACGAPSGTALGWVAYCTGGPHGAEPGFGIRVQWRGSSSQPWDAGCWMGKTPAAPRC